MSSQTMSSKHLNSSDNCAVWQLDQKVKLSSFSLYSVYLFNVF